MGEAIHFEGWCGILDIVEEGGVICFLDFRHCIELMLGGEPRGYNLWDNRLEGLVGAAKRGEITGREK